MNMFSFRRREPIIYGVALAFAGVAELISVAVYSRLLDAVCYGQLVLVLAAASSAAVLAETWISASVIRFHAPAIREGHLSRFYSTALQLLAISVAIAAMLVLALDSVGVLSMVGLPRHSAESIAFLAGATAVFAVFRACLRCARRPSLYAALSFLAAYGGLLAAVVFLPPTGAYRAIPIALACAFLLASLFSAVFLSSGEDSLRFRFSGFDRTLARRFAVYGIPGALATVGTWLLSLSDRFLISLLAGRDIVAFYTAAYTVADRAVALIVAAIMLAASPAIVSTWESCGNSAAAESIRGYARAMVLLAIPAVGGVSLLAPVFLRLFAPAYIAAAPMVPIVAFSTAIYGIGMLANTLLMIQNRTWRMAANYMLAGFLNVLLNFTLVPRFGAYVAAVTTLVSYSVLLMLHVRATRGFMVFPFPWKTAICAVISCAAMVVFIAIGLRAIGGLLGAAPHASLRNAAITLSLLIPPSIAVYALALCSTGEFDMKRLRSIVVFVATGNSPREQS